jgi:hypothetical protein
MPIVSFIILLSGVPAAHATFIQNNFGLSDPHSTITFGEHVFPDGSALTNQYADLGVVFSPNVYYFSTPNAILPSIPPFFDNTLVTNFIPNIRNIGQIVMSFTQPQTQVAFALGTSSGVTTTFQAFLGGSLVESATAPTDFNLSNNFFGFRDITFDAISVQAFSSGVSQPFGFDNMQLSTAPNPVPEPLTILGSATALGFGAFFKRKLKSSESLEKETTKVG